MTDFPMQSCLFCESTEFDTIDAAASHQSSMHPVIHGDITFMLEIGVPTAVIDEIIMSERYLAGEYPEFKGKKDHETTYHYRVATRMAMLGLA